ncbi:protein translocase subunit SecD [Parvularcula dongshanensis]|uniref:Protein translocase subunit SecD n=1 Tax=Parvularcula dongshanensis TaxID=1173995 RepID=A0A840I7U4_9PROT|nr:protein translocase subunit SecD [Parvularcula dongshanensis]MBB4660351.1 protein-export membrane protein SecD [Parvularcula dongshanensis]
MLQFRPWQVGFVVFLVLLGAYFAAPNFFPKDKTPWGFQDSRVTLGLDLQGGSYLLLRVDTDKVIDDRLRGLERDVRAALRDRGDGGRVQFTGLRRLDGGIVVRIPSEDDLDRAEQRLRSLIGPVGGGLGGLGSPRDLHVEREGDTFTLTLTEEAVTFITDNAVTDSIEVVRRRIDSLGTTEPSIARQGEGRLVVQVPGDDDPEALKSVIARTGQLSFHMVEGPAQIGEPVPPRRIVAPLAEGGGSLVLIEDPEVTGDMVTDASAQPNQDGGGFQVNFAFDGRGARRFGDVTRNNIGRQFAILLDDQIISAPTIQGPITGGSGRITGNFSPEEATELSILIRSGALPAPLTVIEQRTVGADLGADSVKAGTIALIIGFVAVVAYIVVSYGRFGIYADIALLANVVLIAGALSVLGATLTLPGIAGIVLVIGMAVDANVLIFERIKEELKAGRKPVAAVEQGYGQAWSAIFDANLTTLIAAFIMFMLGAGPVRGFAITLGIGTVTSVFTAYVITRIFAGRYVLAKRPKTLSL